MRVLVLGGAGMLGHKVTQELRARGHEVIPTIRSAASELSPLAASILRPESVLDRLDVADESALRSAVLRVAPDAVVNAVGVIKQRGAAKEAVPSLRINSLLPHLLAEWAEDAGYRLVHFSTDCVFDGSRGSYDETAFPDATDLYGRSKALGEVGLSPRAITLRTSIVGRELSHFASLVEWFLSQAGGSVRGYRRAIYTGLTTNEMATVVARLLEERPALYGLWHVAAPPITKYDLLVRLDRAYATGTKIVPDDDFVLDRSLVSARFWRDSGFAPPEWEGMIERMAGDPTPYPLPGFRG